MLVKWQEKGKKINQQRQTTMFDRLDAKKKNLHQTHPLQFLSYRTIPPAGLHDRQLMKIVLAYKSIV